jgi:hypothetical protein
MKTERWIAIVGVEDWDIWGLGSRLSKMLSGGDQPYQKVN